LAQQVGFHRELAALLAEAKRTGAIARPAVRQRLTEAWIGLRLLRYNALRTLSSVDHAPGPEASISKLQWATWHRELANLSMDVRGASAMLDQDEATALFLFTRADTIYGGSNQIQRNVIGERALGLPKEPA